MGESYIHCFANPDGTIQELDTDHSEVADYEDPSDVIVALKSLFEQCCTDVVCDPVQEGRKKPEVFDVRAKFEDGDLTCRVGAKGVRPGGQGRAKDEDRIQPRGESFRSVYEAYEENGNAFWLGFYQRGASLIVVAWRPKFTDKDSGNTNKVNTQTIAGAMKYGIMQEKRKRGDESVVAFRPEFFNVFLVNREFFLGEKSESGGAETKSEGKEGDNRLEEPQNLIYFGAPGTGKSHQLNLKAYGEEEQGVEGCFDEENIRRVTFHPDYTYSQYVGSFKPFIEPQVDEDSPASAIKYAPGTIEYKFVPGPFINTYVDAIRHPDQNYLLIIEEINRANPAAVFGDMFQLLDRKPDGTSKYSVVTSEDLRWYLFKQWKSHLNSIKPQERSDVLYSLDDPEAEKLASSIALPDNMYIWATMNSADQGVYPMDTAFKRRWDFEYMDINDGEGVVADCEVPNGDTGENVRWNWLRKLINAALLDIGVNEDKLLGPFFVAPAALEDEDQFKKVFENKVLMYLYEDAAKLKRKDFFNNANWTYSVVCKEYKDGGIEAVLNKGILGELSSNLNEFRHIGDMPSEGEPSVEPDDTDE